MESRSFEQAMQAVRDADQAIFRLLCQRHRLAAQLAQALTQQGRQPLIDGRIPAVISRLTFRNLGPLADESVARVFETVIQATEPCLQGVPTAHSGQ